jgi:nickel-dependent lactate racemase
MNINIPFAQTEIGLTIHDRIVQDVIYPNRVLIGDEIQTIQSGLSHPFSSPSLDEFLADGRDVLFIVNDHTRPTPTAKILDVLEEKINRMPVRFLIATGSHRAPTAKELKIIFGKHFERFKNVIHIHNANDRDAMVPMGVSSKGTVLKFNRLPVDAQKIVIIGSVEPHYYAGFTGGRKAVLPGVASYDTIEQNHCYAMDENAQIFKLEGNPVHEDMEDGLRVIQEKSIFSIMMVLDQNEHIYHVTSGELSSSFLAATHKALEVYSVPVQKKAGIVVAVVIPPLDINLYQSHKAMEQAKLALKENGILILVSSCWDGIGPGTFVDILSDSKSKKEALKKVEQTYRLGFHKVKRIVQMLDRFEIWAVTQLDPTLIQSLFFHPVESVQQAVDHAILKKPQEKILFLLNAGITVPKIS